MPRSPKGTSFEDFIKQQYEVNQPTEKEALWSLENFSSRVDPPVDPNDNGGEEPGPGEPGGETAIPCVAATAGSTENMPARLSAHLAVLTCNLDPDHYTVTGATEYGIRGQPLVRGVNRPVRMMPVPLTDDAFKGKGAFMMLRNVTSWGGNDPYIEFNVPNVFEGTNPLPWGTQVRLDAKTGFPAKLYLPNFSHFNKVSDKVVILDTGSINVPLGDVTHAFWVRLGATTAVYRDINSGYDPDWDTYLEAYDVTTSFYVQYICYDSTGAEIFRHELNSNVTYRCYHDEGLSPEPGGRLTNNMSGIVDRRPSAIYSNASCTHELFGVSAIPLPAGCPTLTHWPLMIGTVPDCHSNFTSLTGNTLMLSEAAAQPGGNGGSVGVGYNIAFNEIEALASVRFYPNRQDVMEDKIPPRSKQKQLFLCHSTTPTTGAGLGSPSLTNTPIPIGIALLTDNPTYASLSLVHGIGAHAHKMLRLTDDNWESGFVAGDESTYHDFIKLTFKYVG